jgi:hypothetical protein
MIQKKSPLVKLNRALAGLSRNIDARKYRRVCRALALQMAFDPAPYWRLHDRAARAVRRTKAEVQK